MEVLKKLLFLICIASTWPMLGMVTMVPEGKLSSEEEEKVDMYREFIKGTVRPTIEERLVIRSSTLNDFTEKLDFGSQEKKTNSHLAYTNIESFPDYKDQLLNSELVDIILVYPKKKKSNTIKRLYISFNFHKFDKLIFNLMRAKFSKTLQAFNEENDRQKREIEKLTEQNKLVNDLTDKIRKLAQENEEFVNQNKLQYSKYEELEDELDKLTSQNKKQKQEIKKLIKQNEELAQQKRLENSTYKAEKEISNTYEGRIEELAEQKKLKAIYKRTEERSETTNKNPHFADADIDKLNLKIKQQCQYRVELQGKLDSIKLKNKEQTRKIEKLTKESSKLLEEAKNKIEKLELQNKQQQSKVEELAKQNQNNIGLLGVLFGTICGIVLQNKQQQKQNTELTQKNKDLGKELNQLKMQKQNAVKKNGHIEKQPIKSSFWQPRNLLFGAAALVIGGVLGAWAHASFK